MHALVSLIDSQDTDYFRPLTLPYVEMGNNSNLLLIAGGRQNLAHKLLALEKPCTWGFKVCYLLKLSGKSLLWLSCLWFLTNMSFPHWWKHYQYRLGQLLRSASSPHYFLLCAVFYNKLVRAFPELSCTCEQDLLVSLKGCGFAFFLFGSRFSWFLFSYCTSSAEKKCLEAYSFQGTHLNSSTKENEGVQCPLVPCSLERA